VGDTPVATRRRLLVAAPFPPRLDGRHGGSRAIAQLLVGLADRHAIALAVLRSPGDPRVDEQLRARCGRVLEVDIPPVGRSLRERLANRVRLRADLFRGVPTWAAEQTSAGFGEQLRRLTLDWQPEVVQLEYRIMGQYLPSLGNVPAKLVLVDHDPDVGEVAVSRLLAPVERWAWRSLGQSAAGRVDALVVFTERDRRLVESLGGRAPVHCIPLAHELPVPPLDPRGAEPASVLFVGSFVHPPNVDCALRLAWKIFPRVRELVPAASLRLVGSQAPPRVLALSGNGISVHPDVPDVRPYLDAAAVVAAPIRLGGGMRVKILEAIAYGKAVVASPVALEGLALRDGIEVVVAESDGDFVGAITTLLRDPQRRVALAQAARRWAELHLDADLRVDAFERLYDSLTRPVASPAPQAG
jgi:glycosyltransferase involved in cell wall biosynthesis